MLQDFFSEAHGIFADVFVQHIKQRLLHSGKENVAVCETMGACVPSTTAS
jgi:hypothetical protein